jgi:hypothetical protein
MDHDSLSGLLFYPGQFQQFGQVFCGCHDKDLVLWQNFIVTAGDYRIDTSGNGDNAERKMIMCFGYFDEVFVG